MRIQHLKGHKSGVDCILKLVDGRIVSAGVGPEDCSLRMWDLADTEVRLDLNSDDKEEEEGSSDDDEDNKELSPYVLCTHQATQEEWTACLD